MRCPECGSSDINGPDHSDYQSVCVECGHWWGESAEQLRQGEMELSATYPLANPGVFRTCQGEGALLGTPMIFVRLGGCSVGCEFCDTNYKVHSRQTAEEIGKQVSQLLYGGVEWSYVTGGEPSDHDLRPLIGMLQSYGLRVALATAGTREIECGLCRCGTDFVSVSPHTADPTKWVLDRADQINIVPGLNGVKLADFDGILQTRWKGFTHRYVTPLMDREGRLVNLQECLDWVNARSGWKLGVQAHKYWNIP